MSRPLRVEFPGALYHVMSRGNERSPIFRSDSDRIDFLNTLASAIHREAFLLHAYCLMDNHFHLLLETPAARLSRGMHWVNGRHAQRFNARHERCGHLFEGRFKAILIQKETHLLELQRYIVLNPVRAGLVSNAEDWRWSSYRATAGLAPPPPWLEVSWTLKQFGRKIDKARRAFIGFVEEGVGISPCDDRVRSDLIAGNRRFVDPMYAALNTIVNEEIPETRRLAAVPALIDIEASVAREWDVNVAELRRHRGGPAKIAAIYLARKLTRLPAREVAAAFEVGRGRVANAVAEIERGKHRDMRDLLDRLMDGLRADAVRRNRQEN